MTIILDKASTFCKILKSKNIRKLDNRNKIMQSEKKDVLNPSYILIEISNNI